MNRYFAKVFCQTPLLCLALCAIILLLTFTFISDTGQNKEHNVVQIPLNEEIHIALIDTPLPKQSIALEGNRKFVEFYTDEDFQNDISNSKEDISLQHCIKFYKDLVTICLHPEKDIISDQLRSHGLWETELNLLMVNALNMFPKNDTVFLDVGTNIGAHSLPIAALGNRVWSIEPTKSNLVRLEKSRRMSNLDRDRMIIVRNAVADVRSTVVMSIPFIDSNFGGAMALLMDSTSDTQSQDLVRSVLLSDVMDAIQFDHGINSQGKLNVVMKIDVEGFECKAFLGSKEMFQPNQLFTIPFIIMEWRFSMDFDTCSPEMQMDLVKMLSSAGYLPHEILRSSEIFRELEISEVDDWELMDLAWILKDNADQIKKELIRTRETNIKAYGKQREFLGVRVM